MPSKGKKQSKSSLGRSPAAPSPATPCREPVSEASDDAFNRRLLSDAAARFPHLISESAFRGVVSDAETFPSNGSHSRIWLSEAFMVSSSLRPGFLVSVALAASEKEPLKEFPLYSFVENSIVNFGFDVGGSFLNKVGFYFAIASVFSSNKLQKNGVRLSWGLSCTMGFPAIGQALFIFSIGDFSSCHNESNKNNTCHLRLHKCRNLNLNMLPITFHDSIPTNSSLTESASTANGYGNSESPKTPSYHSKLPSTFTTPLHLKISHRSSQGSYSSACLDVSALKLALADEESKLLYEKFSSQWLYGRFLLQGNLVAVPVCGKVLLFSVEGADELTTRCSSQDLISQDNNDMLLDGAKRVSSLGTEYTALYVEAKTKISFSGPISRAFGSSSERVILGGNASEFINGKEPSDLPILGGLSKEFAALEEIIKFSLAQKDPLLRYTGVLLHGPPGTGKTTLASYCVRDAGARLFLVNGPEIVSQYFGESEQALNDIFDSARRAAPAVVFIDELDAIAPSRMGGGEELSIRMVATLLKLMDDIKRSNGILVIAATNRPDSIDPALRRPGRLDREIEIGVPSPVQRLDILHTLLNHMDHSLSNSEIESLAFETHGFVGADLAALCNEAAMTALRRLIKFEKLFKCSHSKTGAVDKDNQAPNIQEIGKASYNDDLNSLSSFLSELTVSPMPVWQDNSLNFTESNRLCCSRGSDGEGQNILLKVNAEDFEVAKMKVRPSAMREVMLELPKVSWEDVGGQREVKRQLIEAVQWPQVHPEAFKRIGVQPPRGLLMIGPPGCSKTMMARAVAAEAKLNFLAVKGPELFSKWVGESEKAVRSIFAKARVNAPAIIFFDEIDGLAVTRGAENDGTSVADRVLSQLLVEMDGLDQRVRVTVIAATNRPDKIDAALLRPGRFDRILDVQPPNELDREDIFRIHTRHVPYSSDVNLSELARLTPGYTGADIKLVCREAAVAALEENLEISEVSMEHFRIGIRRVYPSEVIFYQELAEQFRRLVDGGST
ncbi:calmodulin-interacting protein 111 [Dendrobium catenatum]|uniref:Calmodulin-interacting protein 111 n=1 Tax=Dendrobium catenatum TaxID=906689 RepID=A0A2I0W591_9ASPA|nr:calmodulin-interacting protein 111 [Dendrobium catenatum]XP_020680740.1 calmodulin-interacting protein 111 [Dendrobium catenatum]PKU70817.1 Calmodulin-interacting protein 111 [Dendrobium catenatum]